MKIKEEQTFGIARKIKANMTGESWEHITHSVVSYEADVTELMPLIKKMNEGATRENKITVNSVMLKIITEGIKVMPLINSHLEFNRKLVRGTLKVFDTIYRNVAVAISELYVGIIWKLFVVTYFQDDADSSGEESSSAEHEDS